MNASGSCLAGVFAFPSLSAWRALSIQGWLRGEHSLLLLPKPQQMTTFRSVISLGSTARRAIHFSTIKGQQSPGRAMMSSAVQWESRRQAAERVACRSGCHSAFLSPARYSDQPVGLSIGQRAGSGRQAMQLDIMQSEQAWVALASSGAHECAVQTPMRTCTHPAWVVLHHWHLVLLICNCGCWIYKETWEIM